MACKKGLLVRRQPSDFKNRRPNFFGSSFITLLSWWASAFESLDKNAARTLPDLGPY